MNQGKCAVNNSSNQDALLFIAWSRAWSPLIEAQLRRESVDLLTQGLPADWENHYWSTFHFANPQAPIPLLLHAALNLNGNQLREEFTRVAYHLQMSVSDHPLPPDHIAGVCELMAKAIEADEQLILRKLSQHYLLPWCDFARQQMKSSHLENLVILVHQFGDDLSIF